MKVVFKKLNAAFLITVISLKTELGFRLVVKMLKNHGI